jgi:hypothetical protein
MSITTLADFGWKKVCTRTKENISHSFSGTKNHVQTTTCAKCGKEVDSLPTCTGMHAAATT